MDPLTVTDPVAPDPPPPEMVIFGGDAASYSEPALVILIAVTGPNVFLTLDLYDQTDVPLIQVPIGPGTILSLIEIVDGFNGNLFNLRWLPGKSADPGKGPIL